MADKAKKISELGSMTYAQMNANNLVVIVDNVASQTKKATLRELNSMLNDLPHHLPIQRVTTTTGATNPDYKVVLCDPSTAGGVIQYTMQTVYIDGKDFFVKNINTGSYSVVVSCANNGMETSSGTFANSVTLSNTGDYGHWIWDDNSSVYRLIGGNF